MTNGSNPTMAQTIYLLHSNLQRLQMHSLPALDIMDNQVIFTIFYVSIEEIWNQEFLWTRNRSNSLCGYKYFTIKWLC